MEVTELAATRVLGDKREDGIKGRTLIERTVGIGDEEQCHTSLFQHNLLTTKLLTETTQRHDTHQFLPHLRHRTKAVNQSRTIRCQLLVRMQVIQFPIQQHPLTIRRHILVREIEGKVGVYDGVGNEMLGVLRVLGVFGELGSNLLYCLIQNLLVRLVTEVGDEARLFST